MSPFSQPAIETVYERLGHHLGWRLLTCPARNIETTKVALVTTNPGGQELEPPLWSVEAVSEFEWSFIRKMGGMKA